MEWMSLKKDTPPLQGMFAFYFVCVCVLERKRELGKILVFFSFGERVCVFMYV